VTMRLVRGTEVIVSVEHSGRIIDHRYTVENVQLFVIRAWLRCYNFKCIQILWLIVCQSALNTAHAHDHKILRLVISMDCTSVLESS